MAYPSSWCPTRGLGCPEKRWSPFYGAGPGLLRGRNVCFRCSVHTGILQKFGPLEAIFLTTFVGLSVDYIVHVAHAYSKSLAGTRRQRWGKHLCAWAVLC